MKEDSEEVTYIIAGYAVKKLIKSLKYSECKTILIGTNTEMPYFQLLSRGGLITPSPTLANIFGRGFAVLDAAEYVLSEQLNEINVGCNDHHEERCKKFAIKIIINIFYNKQKISSDQVRKEMLAAFKKQRYKIN